MTKDTWRRSRRRRRVAAGRVSRVNPQLTADVKLGLHPSQHVTCVQLCLTSQETVKKSNTVAPGEPSGTRLWFVFFFCLLKVFLFKTKQKKTTLKHQRVTLTEAHSDWQAEIFYQSWFTWIRPAVQVGSLGLPFPCNNAMHQNSASLFCVSTGQSGFGRLPFYARF